MIGIQYPPGKCPDSGDVNGRTGARPPLKFYQFEWCFARCEVRRQGPCRVRVNVSCSFAFEVRRRVNLFKFCCYRVKLLETEK